MPTYKASKLLGRTTQAIDAGKLGMCYPLELLDDNGKTILVLYYVDESSADEAAEVLQALGNGLVGITDPSF